MPGDRVAQTLPPIPEPPSFGPDPRQEQFYQEVGRLLEDVCEHDGLEVVGLTDWTGFPAACPDLGKVSDLIHQAFGHWPEEALKTHWAAAVMPWINHLLSVWVQRVRRREMRLLPGRIVELFLMTRDDRGDYSFHVRVNLSTPRRQAA